MTRGVREPLGILIEAGPKGELIPGRKLESDRTAHAGDLLYEGYKLNTGGQRISYLNFADQKIYTYSPTYAAFPVARTFTTIEQVKEDFEIRFDLPRPTLKKVRLTSDELYQDPLVPPDSYRKISAADRERIARALASSQPPYRAPLARMTTAWLAERENQAEKALRDYLALAAIWNAGWIQRRIPDVKRNLQIEQQRLVLANQSPTRWAVVIGVRRHEHMPELRLADRDAELFQSFLTDPKGGGVPASNVITLTNQAARTAVIRNTLSDVLARRAGPRDTVYIFLSTYGLTEKDSPPERGYLLGFDSVPAEKQAAAYALADMGQVVRAAAPHIKRILLFADVSGSGETASPMNEIFQRQLTPVSGEVQVILSAGGAVEQSAATPSEGPRPFSRALVEGLRGGAAGAMDQVDVAKLYAYVSSRVRRETRNRTEVSHFGSPEGSAREIVFDAPVTAEPILLALTNRFRLRLPLMQAAQSGAPEIDSAALALEERGQEVIRTYLRGHEVQQDKDDFNRASKFFSEAESLNQSAYLEARRLFCEGRWLTFQKNYKGAVPLLQQSIAIDPAGAYAYNGLGIAYLEQAQYDKAAWAFRDALRLAPRWVYPANNLALTYSEAGLYRAAEKEYRAALRIAPEYASLHYSLGALLHRLNRIEEAEAEYNRALQYNPRQPEALVGLGLLRAAASQWPEAENRYTEALRLDKNSHTAWHNLADLYIQEGRFDDAIAALRENLRLKPEFLPSKMKLAEAYNRAGRFEDASREYDAILKQLPDSVTVRLAMIENLADQFAGSGAREQAAQQYRAALKFADTDSGRNRIKKKLRRLRVRSGS